MSASRIASRARLPVADGRPADEMADEAGSEHPARQVPAGGVALESARKVAADRNDGRAGDMRIGAGGDDFTQHHSLPSLNFASVDPARLEPLLTNNFVLSMALNSMRAKSFAIEWRGNRVLPRIVKVVSYWLICSAA